MNPKAVVPATILGGIVLFVLDLIISRAAVVVAPFDIFAIGGMRKPDDPVLMLFFIYPFVFACAAAIVYGVVHRAIEGEFLKKGITFGVLLLVVVTIPGLYVIATSMSYPPGFYIQNLATALIGYPALGIIFTAIWNRYEGEIEQT